MLDNLLAARQKFLAIDLGLTGSLDSQSNLIPLDPLDGDADAAIDHNRFLQTSAKNQHVSRFLSWCVKD